MSLTCSLQSTNCHVGGDGSRFRDAMACVFTLGRSAGTQFRGVRNTRLMFKHDLIL